MHKLYVFICAMLAFSYGLSAQVPEVVKEMQSKGLPKNAVPAKFYFSHVYETEKPTTYGVSEMGESSIIVPDATGEGGDKEYFIFVVPQKIQGEESFPYVDIWVVDGETDNVHRAFHQSPSNYGEQIVNEICFLGDVTTRDSVYTDKKTKQRITLHRKYGKLVMAMQMQEDNGTGHGIISTVILDSETGDTTMLRGEKLVGVLSPLTNMLMLVEWNLAQNYILTTTSSVISDDPYEETDDFTIFSHIQLTPILKIYSPSGELIGVNELPVNHIDMIR